MRRACTPACLEDPLSATPSTGPAVWTHPQWLEAHHSSTCLEVSFDLEADVQSKLPESRQQLQTMIVLKW